MAVWYDTIERAIAIFSAQRSNNRTAQKAWQHHTEIVETLFDARPVDAAGIIECHIENSNR